MDDDARFNEMLAQIEAGYPTLDGPAVATAWQMLQTDAATLASQLGREDGLIDVLCK